MYGIMLDLHVDMDMILHMYHVLCIHLYVMYVCVCDDVFVWQSVYTMYVYEFTNMRVCVCVNVHRCIHKTDGGIEWREDSAVRPILWTCLIDTLW